MKLKLDENGHAVLQDGKPVYVHDDGKEVAFDAPATVLTISRLNFEAMSHRERAEAAEKTIKAFEGIDDPAAARKALETVANLDSKQLIDAGEVEKVKAEIRKALQAQLDEANAKAQTFEQQLYAEKIGGAFSRSKLIAEKFIIPADLVQARFGNAFKIEDGKTVAYDQTGNKIFSRARPGELADFDEALEVLVDQYPHKEQILKASGANGGGAGVSNGAVSPSGNFGGSRDERKAAIAAKFNLPTA
ncbi:hypothetical protein D7I39_10920 [Allopusillimonas ginsengisoli]|nr:hypothetical protein D7I39_10920 [Allopusillimonas ginsengisoli]